MADFRAWVVVCVVALAAASPSGAAADPSATPTPLCCGPGATITAVAVSGTTAYIGGNFRHVGDYTGSFAALHPDSGRAEGGRPVVEGTVNASAPDGNGGWYIGGSFTSVGGVARQNLAHLRADGSLDPVWAPTTDGPVRALAKFGPSVFVGGSFASVNGGTARSNLAGFDAASGAVTDSFGGVSGTGSSVSALGVASSTAQADPDRLYVGGSFAMARDVARTNIAAFDLGTGAVDPSFHPAPDGAVLALQVVDTDPSKFATEWTIYAGGAFTAVGSTARLRLAAFDQAGGLESWNPTAPSPPMVLAAANGKIYFNERFGSGISLLHALDQTSGARDPTFEVVLSTFTEARALAVVGTTLYAGGNFNAVVVAPPPDGEVLRNSLAAFDTTTGAVKAWDPEAVGAVNTLGWDGEQVFAGGDFTSVGGVERSHLAAIDLTSGALTGFDPQVNGRVHALVASGSTLYVGGAFTKVNGSTGRRLLAAFDTGTGTATAFDPNVPGEVRALAVAGDRIVVGGSFSTVNDGVPRSGLADFDAGSGVVRGLSPIIGGGSVLALAIRGPTVFAGGSFTKVNGQNRAYVAALRENGALTAFDATLNGPVYALVIDGSTVYAGGFFSFVNGTVHRPRLAALDADSGAVRGFDAGLDLSVSALALGDGRLFAGGEFGPNTPGLPKRLGAFDPATGTPSAWAPEPDFGVTELAASPESGLVVAGSFRRLQQPSTLAAGLTHFAFRPAAPAAPTATPGDGQATSNVPAAPSGGSPVTSYTVTASPGGRTATASGPGPVVVGGLDNGTTYTFTATATNRVGTGPPSAPSNPVTPGAAAPAPGGRGPGGQGPEGRAADGDSPLISLLSLTNRRFAVGPGSTPAVARAKRGTAFRFTLSEDARTTITIERAVPGRRKGKRCIKPQRRLKRKCTRYVRSHTLTRRGTVRGANRIAYSGRVGRRALGPGRYRATLVATDPAGNRSKPAAVSFAVVRR